MSFQFGSGLKSNSGVKSHASLGIDHTKLGSSREKTLVDDVTSYSGSNTIKDSERGFEIGDRRILKKQRDRADSDFHELSIQSSSPKSSAPSSFPASHAL